MIDLAPNELQRDLVDLVRDLAPAAFPLPAAVVGAADGLGRVADTPWRTLAESGVFALTLPEERGGTGLGPAEELLVFIELGRAIVPGPVVGTALAARIAAEAGSDLAEALASGDRRAGILVGDLVVDAQAGDLAVRVDADGATLYEVTDIEEVPATDPLAIVGRPELSEVLRHDDPVDSLRLRLLVGGYSVGVAAAATTHAVVYG
jgi:alkylation response protein AidB-like acyl-CoA dehydrogenase